MTATLKPIRTDGDRQSAMGEGAQLWGAEAGTAKVDRLEMVIIVIHAYDAQTSLSGITYPINEITLRME